MLDFIKKTLGLKAAPNNGGAMQPTWDAVAKSIRDALLAGAAVAGLMLCESLGAIDLSGTDYAWAGPMIVGALAFARRFLVPYQPKK